MPDGFIKIGKVDELRPGSMKRVDINGRRMLLANVNGRFCATDLTIGQYLRPFTQHLPLVKYYALGAGRHPVDGQPAAYVCRNRTGDAPVTTVEALRERCAT